MRKFIYLFCVSLLIIGCNDGDVITVELDFENTFQSCGELVFYKTKTEPAESLSILISNLTIDDIVETRFVDTDSVLVELFTPSRSIALNGTTNRINYRTYSSLPANPFCSDVPASDLNIISDAVGTGDLLITTTLTEDDNDGIPSDLEDINGNGNYDDDDTDDDGVPNYLDDDDDGDNIKTINEGHNYTEGNGLMNAQNTDADFANGDNIPDYLDNDDDGDGTPTRNEQNFSPEDHNPANDITNSAIGPDYLNPAVNDNTPETEYRPHTIRQIFVVLARVTNLAIPQLSQDVLDFGVLEDTSVTTDTRNVKTIFN